MYSLLVYPMSSVVSKFLFHSPPGMHIYTKYNIVATLNIKFVPQKNMDEIVFSATSLRAHKCNYHFHFILDVYYFIFN